MSTVKVRVVVEETLRYDQVIEMEREDYTAMALSLEPDADADIRDLLDLNAVICLDIDVHQFSIVEDET